MNKNIFISNNYSTHTQREYRDCGRNNFTLFMATIWLIKAISLEGDIIFNAEMDDLQYRGRQDWRFVELISTIRILVVSFTINHLLLNN